MENDTKVLDFCNFIIQDNNYNGNSIFSAIANALKDINNVKISNSETIVPPPLPNSNTVSLSNTFKLRRKIKEYWANSNFNKNFLDLLDQEGFWDDGINGNLGLKTLRILSKIIEKTILLIIQTPDNQFQYCLFETTEGINSLKKHKVKSNDLETILNAHPNAIKLYYDGYYYRAIAKKI